MPETIASPLHQDRLSRRRGNRQAPDSRHLLQALQDIGVLTSEIIGRERLFINTALLKLLTQDNL